jgi:hypothetical protein
MSTKAITMYLGTMGIWWYNLALSINLMNMMILDLCTILGNQSVKNMNLYLLSPNDDLDGKAVAGATSEENADAGGSLPMGAWIGIAIGIAVIIIVIIIVEKKSDDVSFRHWHFKLIT